MRTWLIDCVHGELARDQQRRRVHAPAVRARLATQRRPAWAARAPESAERLALSCVDPSAARITSASTSELYPHCLVSLYVFPCAPLEGSRLWDAADNGVM